jgi:hypothetical protein
VSADRIVVKMDDFRSIDAPQRFFTLPFPMPDTLRPLRP